MGDRADRPTGCLASEEVWLLQYPGAVDAERHLNYVIAAANFGDAALPPAGLAPHGEAQVVATILPRRRGDREGDIRSLDRIDRTGEEQAGDGRVVTG